jgi:hypothetical protein
MYAGTAAGIRYPLPSFRSGSSYVTSADAHLSLASVAALFATTAGFAAAITGVYFFIGAQAQPDRTLGFTLAIVWGAAVLLVNSGVVAFKTSRLQSLPSTLALLGAGFAVEAVGAWLLSYIDSPYRLTAYAAVGGAQLFPLLVAALAVVVVRKVKARMGAMLGQVSSDGALAVVAYPTEREVRAIVRVQAFVRGALIRIP